MFPPYKQQKLDWGLLGRLVSVSYRLSEHMVHLLQSVERIQKVLTSGVFLCLAYLNRPPWSSPLKT